MSPTAKPTAAKAISALVGCVSLIVLFQAVTGGILARNSNHKRLLDSHTGLAYVAAVLALAAVVVAVMMWRGRAGGQVVLAETVALLVLVIIQIGIGQQIGHVAQVGKHPGLLALHIPVALLIFGLTIHLSSFVAGLRRGV
jgi:hypothetical protein